MNSSDHEQTIKELTNMARIYRSFGFFEKADELEQLLHRMRVSDGAGTMVVNIHRVEDSGGKQAN